MKRLFYTLITLILVFAISACGDPVAESPSTTPSNTQTVLPTAGPTVSPTQAPIATSTPTATQKPEPTPQGPVKTSPEVDADNFDANKVFLRVSKSSDNYYNYRIYVPHDYDEQKSYPLLVYLNDDGYGDDNVSQLNDVEKLFANPESPVYDSIIVVPQRATEQSWQKTEAKHMIDLIKQLKVNYCIDKERVYLIGEGIGCWISWYTLLEEPNLVSAYVNAHGVGPTYYVDSNGNPDAMIDTVPEELLDIPFHLVHGSKLMPDSNFHIYGSESLDNLQNLAGFTNVILTENDNYSKDFLDHYITKTDISILEWLFEQRRMTK